MAEIKVTKVEPGQTKIRTVPIAVTPEGFWCCPSPAVFQKAQNKPKSSPPKSTSTAFQKKQSAAAEKRPHNPGSKSSLVLDEQKDKCLNCDAPPIASASALTDRTPGPKTENVPRKVSIEFGESGTSDLKVMLLGKQGVTVKLSVHKSVLIENSSYFWSKISEQHPGFPCLEVDDCEDVEIYVETVGLMYCKELKQRLIKQSVSRVLRILKIAEQLGFTSCIQSCLEYLEAVPWVGEEEEEKVVNSILRLQSGLGVTSVLKRVSSEVTKSPKDTLSHILELVLKSNEERGRREMKSLVLKLLKENNNLPNSVDVFNEIIYSSCRSCLETLLSTFKQAAESESTNKPDECKETTLKKMSLEADNLSWLLEILADQRAADQFAVMWASQEEMATLHTKLPIVSRYHVSCITSRLFVGIGRGELLPSKDTRQSLLKTWLQPLINDYNWLQHGCRSFDRKVVEEGIGRTILTLPLEEQQSIFLTWLGSFLKAGDNCPNLQKAFEVWWRRTFVRPYTEPGGGLPQSDSSVMLNMEDQ